MGVMRLLLLLALLLLATPAWAAGVVEPEREVHSPVLGRPIAYTLYRPETVPEAWQQGLAGVPVVGPRGILRGWSLPVGGPQ